MSTEHTFSITPSHLLEYLYCARYTFFEYVLRLPQSAEKYHKVIKGRQIHHEKAMRQGDYLRKRLGVVKKEVNVYLTTDWLRGEVDEVLWLEDGTMAPLDYKFAKWEGTVYDPYRTQLICYAWLMEANFGKKVNRGYLVYTRSKHHVEEVTIGAEDRAFLKQSAEEMLSIIANQTWPKATKVKKKCLSCTYRNVCPQ